MQVSYSLYHISDIDNWGGFDIYDDVKRKIQIKMSFSVEYGLDNSCCRSVMFRECVPISHLSYHLYNKDFIKCKRYGYALPLQ